MDVDPKTKLPVCTKLVLAFKEKKDGDRSKAKVPLVDVNPRLIRKLKPHQCDGEIKKFIQLLLKFYLVKSVAF